MEQWVYKYKHTLKLHISFSFIRLHSKFLIMFNNLKNTIYISMTMINSDIWNIKTNYIYLSDKNKISFMAQMF